MDFGIEKKFFSKRHFSEIEISIFFQKKPSCLFHEQNGGVSKNLVLPKNTLGVHTIIIEKKNYFYSYFFLLFRRFFGAFSGAVAFFVDEGFVFIRCSIMVRLRVFVVAFLTVSFVAEFLRGDG